MILKISVFTCLFLYSINGELVSEDNIKNETRVRKNFYLSSDEANFFKAYFKCKEGGMNLVSLNSKQDEEDLAQYLKDVDKRTGFWLSATDLSDAGSTQYYWLTGGKRAIYTNWLPGEPNNQNGQEDCLLWQERSGVTGWNDYICQNNLRYICQDVE